MTNGSFMGVTRERDGPPVIHALNLRASRLWDPNRWAKDVRYVGSSANWRAQVEGDGAAGFCARMARPGTSAILSTQTMADRAGDVLATAGGMPASGVEAGVKEVSGVMVRVEVTMGVGVTVAETTAVVVTPGVVVMTTVMVMVSGVGV